MSEKSEGPAKRNGKANAEGVEPKSQAQDKDYKVGYGKPPKHTRFTKGKSGDPRGRPRKKKPRPIKLSDAPSDGYVEAEAYRFIELLENGEKIELPTLRAIVRAMAVSALKGNRLSQKYFLEYVERQEERHLQYKVQNYVRLENLKLDGERSIAERERRGLPPPDLLPHPDDIVLNPATGEAWVAGPETVEDVQLYEHGVQLRNHALLRSAHGFELRRKVPKPEDGKICAYLLFAQMLDHYMPRRYRWQDNAEVCLMMEYKSLTRRERERRIADEFAQLEATRPRLSRITPEMEDEIDRVVGKLFKTRGDASAGRAVIQGGG